MQTLSSELREAGPWAVKTRALVKRFGRTTALAGVDLTVPEGSVYVLVGANGAGKTTTLKVLLDLVVADGGTASVLGLDTRADGGRVRTQIGYVPERDETAYGWMRVGALMRYHAGYYPTWDAAYAEELSRLFDLRPDSKLGQLSKGQQRRVHLLLAMAHRPPLLVMDEPTDGLDPVVREQALSALAGHLARFPTTILLSTHQVHEAERLGDHLGVMRAGRIEAQLSRETLHRCLRRYQIEVPDAWTGVAALEDAVIRRSGSRRELEWTIWGEEAEVAERLRGAGATLRHIDALTLADAAHALLARHAVADPPEVMQPRETVSAGA